MPVFYFDYDNGEGSGAARDEIGADLTDVASAIVEATQTLTELAADTLIGTAERLMAIMVRDELGATRARVSLAYRAETTG
ncbi:DUF6894 family protein [Devosia beringensis]|uniref:DUF6894 family protein n=1 Tax=Devosia beringensis TaxID=2657486 RepID=UPI00186BA16F|nr:hypothetical protein [Devosia beringensis]